ncbi:aprataxin and PNK-like factor isoform X1 [Centrocercus urophasianus]|uniref:aprataxin and PNK-like factor isoform X1 n=1 Tax=Centrocercus urophasianus TaxID=9002 RepID=UPI001C6540C5|nr:aprataxin and PNK-like factor isoform X1 [Centrocercus urophasianus]
MAGVRLAPCDGGCPVALPPGETLLGRGPLLGITDKRISRKHAILEVVGGQVRIKPIHVDSCFYQSPENGRLLPLEAHEWHSLKFGDSFSLMVDKYIFKVLSAQPVESADRNNEDAEAAVSVRPVEISHSPSLPEPACSTSEMQGSTEIRSSDSTSTHLVPFCDDSEGEQSKSIQRRRVLPSWMLEKNLLVPRISEPIMKGGDRNKKSQGRGKSDMESLKSEVSILQGKRSASEEIKENFEDEEQDEEEGRRLSSPLQNASGFPLESTMGNMERKGKTETKKAGSSVEKSNRQLHSKRSKPSGQMSSKINRLEESENKGQLTCSTSQQAPRGRTSPTGAQEGAYEPNADMDYDTEISYTTKGAEASESSRKIKHKRTPCMYGAACYRRNPVHFQQFSHPNDDDYYETHSVTQDDNDNRPECPYGTACYRKNPQHKLEYKHTVPPVTERRTRQRTSKNGKRGLEEDSDDDGGPNEYDLNDSFIDDEEEECEPTDEDSDWEPSSEEKEDVETLVKEAQGFVKTKK